VLLLAAVEAVKIFMELEIMVVRPLWLDRRPLMVAQVAAETEDNLERVVVVVVEDLDNLQQVVLETKEETVVLV
jgi:hypothetical protein